MQLSGKTALLTGATGGLGRAIASSLASRGATLILSSRKGAELEELAASLPGEGHSTFVCDLNEDGAGEALIAEVGEFDILIANAGLGGGDAIADADAAVIKIVMRVNLEVPMVMSAAASKAIRDRGAEGHIVLISSLAGKLIPTGSTLYSASKHGLRVFGTGLAADLDGSGIGVSLIYPGFVREAGMFHDSGRKAPPGLGTAAPDEVGEAVAGAIEDEKLHVDVAPLAQRSLANIGMHSPRLIQELEKRMG